MAGYYLWYHYVRRAGGRADGVYKFDHLYLGHHLTNPYGPSYMYVVWTKFCVSCFFPWSGPMVPILLPLDIMSFVPLVAILNLLKI